jgi:plastocyanin
VSVSRTRSLLAATAAGAALTLSACGGGPPPAAAAQAPTAPSQAAQSPAASSSAVTTSPVATTSVSIANFAFSPAAITVKAGATVTWTNRDEDAHTVAITGAPVSQPLQNGDTFTHVFARPGTYSYLCTIHPFMRGMVVVTAG